MLEIQRDLGLLLPLCGAHSVYKAPSAGFSCDLTDAFGRSCESLSDLSAVQQLHSVFLHSGRKQKKKLLVGLI